MVAGEPRAIVLKGVVFTRELDRYVSWFEETPTPFATRFPGSRTTAVPFVHVIVMDSYNRVLMGNRRFFTGDVPPASHKGASGALFWIGMYLTGSMDIPHLA